MNPDEHVVDEAEARRAIAERNTLALTRICAALLRERENLRHMCRESRKATESDLRRHETEIRIDRFLGKMLADGHVEVGEITNLRETMLDAVFNGFGTMEDDGEICVVARHSNRMHWMQESSSLHVQCFEFMKTEREALTGWSVK